MINDPTDDMFKMLDFDRPTSHFVIRNSNTKMRASIAAMGLALAMTDERPAYRAPRRKRQPSGKDRTKTKAARKQRYRS